MRLAGPRFVQLASRTADRSGSTGSSDPGCPSRSSRPLLAESVWLLNAPPATCGNVVFCGRLRRDLSGRRALRVDDAVFTVGGDLHADLVARRRIAGVGDVVGRQRVGGIRRAGDGGAVRAGRVAANPLVRERRGWPACCPMRCSSMPGSTAPARRSALPEIDGTTELRGAITAVAAESADPVVAEPPLEAVVVAFNVCPTSVAAAVYVWLVAPADRGAVVAARVAALPLVADRETARAVPRADRGREHLSVLLRRRRRDHRGAGVERRDGERLGTRRRRRAGTHECGHDDDDPRADVGGLQRVGVRRARGTERRRAARARARRALEPLVLEPEAALVGPVAVVDRGEHVARPGPRRSAPPGRRSRAGAA